MKLRLTFVLLTAFVVASCASGPAVHKTTCDPGPRGNPKEIPIPIVFTPNKIDDPRTACARPGDVLRFMLNGRPDVVVKIYSDDPDAPWLRGSGKIFPGGKEGWFWVSIPLDAEEGEFKYTITAGTIVLDPAVRIRHEY